MPDSDMSAEIPTGVTRTRTIDVKPVVTATRPPELSAPPITGEKGELQRARQAVAVEINKKKVDDEFRLPEGIRQEVGPDGRPVLQFETTWMGAGFLPGLGRVFERVGTRVENIIRPVVEPVRDAMAYSWGLVKTRQFGELAKSAILGFYELGLVRDRAVLGGTRAAIDKTKRLGEAWFSIISTPSRIWESLLPVIAWKEINRWVEERIIEDLLLPARSQLAMDLFKRRNGLQDWDDFHLRTLESKWDDPKAIFGINQAKDRYDWRKDTVDNLSFALKMVKTGRLELGIAKSKVGETLSHEEQLERFYELLNFLNVTDAAYFIKRAALKRISWKVTADGVAYLNAKSDVKVRPSITWLDQTPIEEIRSGAGPTGGWTLNIWDFDATVQKLRDYMDTKGISVGGSYRAPVPG